MKTIILTLLLIFANPAFAVSPESKAALDEAYSLYSKGAYAQSLTKLEQIPNEDNETKSSVAYFIGLNQAKLQNFSAAASAFRQAISLGHKSKELHYELGQALYGDQLIDEATKEFKRSIVAGYKISASAYYVAFIAQLKDDKKTALDFYSRIQRVKSDAEKVKQPSLYQIAEIHFDTAKEIKDDAERRKKLKNEILPLYKSARDFDKKSATATQAEARISEIENLITVNAKMRNGTPIPQKLYTARVSQEVEYDSNVVVKADDAITSVTDKDAVILRTGVFGRYQFNFNDTWTLMPEFNSNIALHMRRNTPSIYENDAITMTGTLRGRHEHWLKGKAATGLFEVEYNKINRDWQQKHEFPYYSSYWNFTIGERAEIFNIGTSTLKFNLKLNDNKDITRSNVNPGISYTQLLRLKNGLEWVHTLGFDSVRARSELNDERNYKYNTNVTFLKLFWAIDFTPSLALSLKDTINQQPTRGWEKNINPKINFRRDVFKSAYMELDYSFTRNISGDTTSYQYRRHQIKTSFFYSF